VEEFAFRGCIQGKLKPLLGAIVRERQVAVLIVSSALLFALAHGLIDALSSPSSALTGLAVPEQGRRV
jgi:membrane protease YdiL (CAAX protease family)